MSPHPVGDEAKTITADDDIFVVLTESPDVSTPCGSQSHRASLLELRVGYRDRCVTVIRQKLAGKHEASLAVVRIGFEPSSPDVELCLRRLMQECADVCERHSRLTECINHPGFGHLARRVVAIPRVRVHRHWGEKSFRGVGPEPLGREPGAFRELTDCHEVIHKTQFEP